jgi:hypothetical protein
MKKSAWTAALTVIVVLTLLAGYMQGNLRRRWGASNAEQTAAARLMEFPKTLGDWGTGTVDDGELGEDALRMLQPSAYHVRTFKSSKSNIPVSMTLLMGPPGYIGAHTPEVCVSGIGYKQLEPKEKVTITDPDDPTVEHTFWVATFRSRGLDQHLLREYWAWSTGGPWEAAEGSRTEYGWYPYLYKVQLGCRLPAGSDPALADPTKSLLEALGAASPAYLLTEAQAKAVGEKGTASTDATSETE